MHIWPKQVGDQFRSLWLSHTSPRKIALALALGVLIGASPLWGMHTALAIAVSLLVGLNKPAVLFGTLISNPLFAPFLIFFSLESGSWLLYRRAAQLSLDQVKNMLKHPDWQDLLRQYLLPYCLGSVVVGILLAFLTFWISLWIARSRLAGDHSAGRGFGEK